MATVTVFTADRMQAIEDNAIVDGEVDSNGHLILETNDGTFIDAGPVVAAAGTPFVGQYTTAGRPAAATMNGKIYWDIDEASFWISDGSTWTEVDMGSSLTGVYIGQYLTDDRPLAAANTGLVLWDIDVGAFFVSDGSDWNQVIMGGGGGSAAEVTFAPVPGVISATDVQAAIEEVRADAIQRANHTGFQLANTISNFATAVFAAGAATDSELQALIEDFNDLVTVSGDGETTTVDAGGVVRLSTLARDCAIPLTAVATSDVLRTSTTFADDSELVVPVEANKVYEFRLTLYYMADISDDIKVSLVGPAGASAKSGLISAIAGTTIGANTTISRTSTVGLGGTHVFGGIGAGVLGNEMVGEVIGVLTVAATAGDFKVQWAVNDTDGGGVLVGAQRNIGSRLTLRRIA